MFKEGQLIYFADFEFNNGDSPKDKYFIVLKETENSLIIGALPTRNNKIPAFVDIDHGCINIEERMYNCYLFQKNKVICKGGFCFEMPTFIYGGDIEYYNKQKMIETYPTEGVHYQVQGELTDVEYHSVLDCLKNSNSVKRGIKRQLG